VRRWIKDAVARVAWGTGVTARLRRSGARAGSGHGFHVFCFHRIGNARGPFHPGMPLEDFERCATFLARHYRVMPLHELATRSANGDPVGDAAAITFDDGYRDNLEVALPVLEKHGLPATVFLATAAIETGEPLWHDRVAYILEQTEKPELALTAGGIRHAFALPRLSARLEAAAEACRILKTLPEAEKIRAVESLRKDAGVPDYAGLRGDMLAWDDVRAMIPRGITFGAHTVNHPILTRIPPEAARQEIADSKRQIEAETEAPCLTFAYPNGAPGEDFDAATERLVAEAGFVCAGSRGFEANPPGGNPFDLRRWTPHPYSIPLLALRMAWTARP
jgi:peptidoglycan/xylan/chitin deacetylase (PgdA/CDA1 family)